MKKLFLLILIAAACLAPMSMQAQVTIGSNEAPDGNALLDLKNKPDKTSDKGLLLPRVALTKTTEFTPLTAHVAGMTVYNTATSNDVTPGYYYNDGTKWVRLMADTALNFWSIVGNNGTTPGTNYLGTNDAQSLMFKINNVMAGYLDETKRKNTTYGRGAFPNVMTAVAANNVAFGDGALASLTKGFTPPSNIIMAGNVAIGQGALSGGDIIGLSIGIGTGAMANAKNSWNNTAIGNNVMEKLDGGSLNVGIGGTALGSLTSGGHNVAVGLGAGNAVTTGDGNIIFGYQTGQNITTGHYNIAIGGHQVYVPNATGNFQLNIGNLITGTGLSGGVGGASESFTAQEQIQKVGIAQASNLISEVLDVNGTARIRQLPAHSTGKVYTKGDGTTSALQDQTFTATRTLVADANGVLGTVPGLPENNFWRLTGNAGTTAGTNFVGTIDDQDLMFKRFNVQAGRLGTSNTTYGLNAGAMITGTDNVTVGVNAGAKMTTGTDNVAIGVNALTTSANGDNSIAIGKDALKVASTSIKNIAIGSGALASHTGATLTTSYNIAVGYNALNKNTTGGYNISLGNASLSSNTSGSSNIALGQNALFTSTTGSNNVSIGYESSNKNTHSNNTVIGIQALKTTGTGGSNVVVGYRAAYGADQNNAVNAFGTNNTALGTQAMQMGQGTGNTAVGSGAGANINGNKNIAIGFNAMENTTTGDYNVFIGSEIVPTLSTKVDNNIILGSKQTLAITTASNQLNIGGTIFGTDMTGNATTPAGKIGIKTTAPTSTFHVNGSFSGNIRTMTGGSLSAPVELLDDDYTVVVSSGVVALPAASGCKGRVYNVVSSGNMSVDYGSGTNLPMGPTGSPKAASFQSTGTSWVIISTRN